MVVTTSTNGTCATTALYSCGAWIDHRPHQQAAGAAAHGVDAPWLAVAVFDQRLGGVDEIVETVRFVRQLALFVPALPQLAAAAHVDQRIDEAAIQQADAVGAERWIHAHAVSAVAVHQQRVMPVLNSDVRYTSETGTFTPSRAVTQMRSL